MSTINKRPQYRQIAFLQGHHFILNSSTTPGRIEELNALLDESIRSGKAKLIVSVSVTPINGEKA